MSDYRIWQDSLGYYVQVDNGNWTGGGFRAPSWIPKYETLSRHKTLKTAKKEKERLEILQGREVE